MTPNAARDSRRRSVPDHFEGFDLSIERLGETYRAQVTGSPVGPRPPVDLDSSQLDAGESSLGARTEPTRDVRRQPADRAGLQRVGERLFRAVFAGAIAEAFRTSIERVRRGGAGLRVRLHLDRAPELATLPWEALWDPTDRAFLADHADLPIVRGLDIAAESPAIGPVPAPLRLSALLPEPRGEGKLSGEEEWQRIQEHLAPLIASGALAADRIEPPTLVALGRRIDDAPCNVLHVVAHGAPGGAGTGGLLKLEDATGSSDTVTGGDLARALSRRRPPRLVVLNACHGARAAVDDAFDGLAQHLLSRGIPAVVSMRTSISDSAAVFFAAGLYRELAAGQTVEGAMVEARRALSLGEHRTEWATPALYLRGDNVRVLAAADHSASRTSRPFRKPRTLWPAVGALATLVAATVLISQMVKTGSENCPTPPGLHDLEFVEIEEDVLPLGDREIFVQHAFCIATKEVSRRDWLEVMGGDLPRPSWPLDWPMTDVTPEDAQRFLEGLSARSTGEIYRLPTAAEWELAARAESKTAYFFGDDPADLHRFGNCRNFLGRDRFDGPAPIASFRPNRRGLYDVHGNVAEWVQWPEALGSPVNDKGQPLALRLGGSFDNARTTCTFSGSHSAVNAEVGNRNDTGFRVVRELVNAGVGS